MKHAKHLILFITTVILLSACATATVLNQTYPARAHDANVDVYITNEPTCEYEEIALISCNSVNDQRSINKIKAKARELGADAVIITDRAEKVGVGIPLEGVTIVSSDKYGFNAIAIKYKK